ncbi:MAG: ATP-binding protein [Gemmatimonadales bacterium]|jgi:PAS domain S-box-containing protein
MTAGNASAGWRAESSGARLPGQDDIRPLSERTVDSDLYRLLVHSVTDYGIFLLDPAGHVASWNEGAQRIKGYSADDIIGRHFSAFYPAEDIASGKPDMELEVAARVGRFEDEGWRVRKDGSLFWANVIITALRNDAAELVGFAKVTRDLTERRAAEQRAIDDTRRIAEVEVANRTKSEFLATMSHELRTPLNAIGGYAELMELEIGGPVTEQQQGYLSRIRGSQQHLLGIITDLLNYSRLEAGQLSYNVQRMPVRAIIETVVPLVGPQATTRKITLGFDPCAPQMIVRADRAKVEQIVLNLLSNALKFTPGGGSVDVSCDLVGDRVAIVVRDTGVGIPDDQLDAIFEPFVQLGRSLSKMHEGTGLGLAISRDLARAMDGDVTVESTVDSGSTFRLLLPRG